MIIAIFLGELIALAIVGVVSALVPTKPWDVVDASTVFPKQ